MELTINKARVYVATGGKDFNADLPTVLFLHGSGGDHRTWALQTRWFAFHGYSVLAPDLPGHSLSGGKVFSAIEESGPWLSEFLESVGVKAAHVVGHSQGFLSALELAKTAPEKLLSITAVGTAAADVQLGLRPGRAYGNQLCAWHATDCHFARDNER